LYWTKPRSFGYPPSYERFSVNGEVIMKTLSTLILATIMALAGCATAPKMNRLSVGMTKQEVLSVMGEPGSTAAPGAGVEFLRYRLSADGNEARHNITEEYSVKLVNGKVDSYGRMGDFDSAKDPTLKLDIKNR
jgi:hypothetical protein